MKKLRYEVKNLLKSMKGKSAEDREIAFINLKEINDMRFMAEKIIGLAQEAKARVSKNGVITTSSSSSSNMIEYAREYERAYRLQSTSTPDDWIMEAIAAEEAAAAEAQEAEAHALVRAEIALMEDAAKARAVVEKQIEDDAAKARAVVEKQIEDDADLAYAWLIHEQEQQAINNQRHIGAINSQRHGGKSRKQKYRKQKSRKQKSRK